MTAISPALLLYKNNKGVEIMQEIWKDVTRYEGRYKISNFGNLKSLDMVVKCRGGKSRLVSGSILKKRYAPNGYIQYVLCKDGKKEYLYAHRLVAMAFIPNDNNKLNQINHIDENKHNNHVDNLEWCTQHYNNTYGTKIERQLRNTDYIEIGKKQSVPVNQFTKDGMLVRKWPSISEVKRVLKLSASDISCCCRNIKVKTVGGFKWEYAE